ncbi:hypothetical protein [Nocardia tengchongensis]
MIDEQPIVLTDEFFQDPHTIYGRLRERGPVHHVRFPHGVVGWLITDYALARQVSSEPTISKDLRAVADDNRLVGGATVAGPGNSQHMLNADPPHHTRTLATDPARLRWRPSVVIRGLTELPVHCR